MKFKLNGKDYEFDFDLDFDEGDLVEDYGRMSTKEFIQDFTGGEPRSRSLRLFVFLAMRRAGEDVKWSDLGRAKIIGTFGDVIAQAGKTAADAKVKADTDSAPAEAPAVEVGEGEAAVASPDAAPIAKLKRTRKKPVEDAPVAEAV